MKKVIVAGANGFVGRNFLPDLLARGVEIYGIARKRIAMPEIHDTAGNLHWVEGDLYTDSDAIVQDLNAQGAQGADCLYYLAWSGVNASLKNHYEEQIKNITIAQGVLKIAKALGCKRIVNLGTVGEYVSLDGLINEKWIPSPADIYGAVKVAVRNILTVQAQLEGIEIVNTILCSTYGEYRCDDNVISYTIKTLLKGEFPRYGKLEQMWDFLYIRDAVHALYLIGEKGIAGKTYSIGSGTYRHLYEYIGMIRDMIDPSLPLGIGEMGEKYEKVLNSCVDTFQLQKDTGFCPQYSFEEGIRNTITYFKERFMDENT